MGMVLEFPANTTMRRLGETAGGVVEGGAAKILILPVIRVERLPENPGGEPDAASAAGRNRRRRAPRP